MKCFVTGSTGFIGRRLVRELVDQFGAAQVTCFTFTADDELERSGRAVLDGLGVRQICGDLRTWRPPAQELPEPDVLFHLAASTDTGQADHSTNDRGTANLLAVLGERLAGKRVVYASTTAAIDRRGPARAPLDELSPCHPKTEYGRTKLQAERIIEDLRPRLGYDYTILRLATVYGFGTRRNGLFDAFGKWVRGGNPLGRIDWPGRTGLIHLDDVARIFPTLAAEPRAAGELYCVAAESPPIGEIPRQMARALELPFEQLTVPELLWAASRLGLRVPGLFNLGPAYLRNQLWRLSLIVEHGLWVDGGKLRAVYAEPLTPLEEGIYDVLGLPRP